MLSIETGGCNKNGSIMDCNQKNAIEISSKIIEKKGGMKIIDMNIEIEEDSLHFIIEYLPKDNMMLGGGGKFKVLKSDCSVISSEFYQ